MAAVPSKDEVKAYYATNREQLERGISRAVANVTLDRSSEPLQAMAQQLLLEGDREQLVHIKQAALVAKDKVPSRAHRVA